jgi:hypothetical protein
VNTVKVVIRAKLDGKYPCEPRSKFNCHSHRPRSSPNQLVRTVFCHAGGRVFEDHFRVRCPGYLTGREPTMRISTNLLALGCQSGADATLETPIRARSKSTGSRSLRISPLSTPRFTSARIA